MWAVTAGEEIVNDPTLVASHRFIDDARGDLFPIDCAVCLVSEGRIFPMAHRGIGIGGWTL